MSQILRDREGRKLGEIREQGEFLRIWDKEGRTQGYYNPKTNKTHDKDGRTVGSGNLLTTLLRQHENVVGNPCNLGHGWL